MRLPNILPSSSSADFSEETRSPLRETPSASPAGGFVSVLSETMPRRRKNRRRGMEILLFFSAWDGCGFPPENPARPIGYRSHRRALIFSNPTRKKNICRVKSCRFRKCRIGRQYHVPECTGFVTILSNFFTPCGAHGNPCAPHFSVNTNCLRPSKFSPPRGRGSAAGGG